MSRPGIDIGDVRNLVCARHEAAIAADLSVNSIAFPIKVLEAALADPRCHEAAPTIEEVGAFLRSVAPVCEWITAEAAEHAWVAARLLGPGGRA